MNTCPKCGSPQVEEQKNYAKEIGRTWWVCGTFQTRDFYPQHSELCLEREEKNVLQRKVEELHKNYGYLEFNIPPKTTGWDLYITPDFTLNNIKPINWFNRKMQELILGFKWKRQKIS
jgi:hypothetical protein